MIGVPINISPEGNENDWLCMTVDFLIGIYFFGKGCVKQTNTLFLQLFSYFNYILGFSPLFQRPYATKIQKKIAHTTVLNTAFTNALTLQIFKNFMQLHLKKNWNHCASE